LAAWVPFAPAGSDIAGAPAGPFRLLVAGQLRRTGEINLRIAFPEMGEPERRRLLQGCFDSLGRFAR